MNSTQDFRIRRGTPADAHAIGRLLHAFNREYDEPTPPAAEVAERMEELMSDGTTVVVLGGAGSDGLSVLQFRPSIWSRALEGYLAE